jgi:hypothetical protein
MVSIFMVVEEIRRTDPVKFFSFCRSAAWRAAYSRGNARYRPMIAQSTPPRACARQGRRRLTPMFMPQAQAKSQLLKHTSTPP